MRILIVEDEAALREELQRSFEQLGYVVDVAADGEEGAYLARENPLDIAVVDLGLPKISGIEIIREARAHGREYPILILTARGRWQDKVEGLEAGADDYLVKPFHNEELLARVRALVRRAGGWSQSLLSCGPITLATAAQRVEIDDQPVDLTGYEYRVLEYLMLHAGDVVSKSQLTEHLYPDDADRDSNVIEVFIRRLRTKLDPQGTLQPIETLRGRGYRLTPPRRA